VSGTLKSADTPFSGPASGVLTVDTPLMDRQDEIVTALSGRNKKLRRTLRVMKRKYRRVVRVVKDLRGTIATLKDMIVRKATSDRAQFANLKVAVKSLRAQVAAILAARGGRKRYFLGKMSSHWRRV
jgi:D-arabinose 5-phosphate isomerase GutQ